MIEEFPLPKFNGSIFKVYVDPCMQTYTACPNTFTRVYEHMLWCQRNVTDFWYNECDSYSYLVFRSLDDAINFNRVYGAEKLLEQQQEIWLRMKYL